MAAHRCYQGKLQNRTQAEQPAIPQWVQIFRVAGVGMCMGEWCADAGEHLCCWCWQWALLAYSCCHCHCCFCTAPCCSKSCSSHTCSIRTPRVQQHPQVWPEKTKFQGGSLQQFQHCNCTNLLVASLATSCNRLSLPPGAENVILWKLHKLHVSKGKSLHIGAVCCLSSWPKIPSASRAVLKGFTHKSVRPFLSKWAALLWVSLDVVSAI